MPGKILYHFFNPEDLLIETIQQIAKKNKIRKAIVLSFIGSTNEVCLSNLTMGKNKALKKTPIKLDKALEIISMTGHIIPLEANNIRVHMHITLADNNGHVIGGHLDEATILTGGYLFMEILEQGNGANYD